MASKNKITEMIAAIKTVYPYFAKGIDVQTLVRLWGALLAEYPDRVVEAAVFGCLRQCKMPPTPADVIEQIEHAAEGDGPSDEELWGAYVQAIRAVSVQVYRLRYPLAGEDPYEEIDKCWQGLPERVRLYIGGRSELMRLAREADEEQLRYERARFFKTMPRIRTRCRTAASLSALTPPARLSGG